MFCVNNNIGGCCITVVLTCNSQNTKFIMPQVMHGYIADFEKLLERIQDMAESGNKEQRMLNIETLTSPGMQHGPSATVSTQPTGQPSSPESPLKDDGNVVDLCNDGGRSKEDDDEFEIEEEEDGDDGLTEDAAHFVMEAIWIEAEALVEAEAKAEDDAWAKLTKTIEVCMMTMISAHVYLRLRERGALDHLNETIDTDHSSSGTHTIYVFLVNSAVTLILFKNCYSLSGIN